MRDTAARVFLVKQRIYKCRVRRTCVLTAMLSGALVPLLCVGKSSQKVEKESAKVCAYANRRAGE